MKFIAPAFAVLGLGLVGVAGIAAEPETTEMLKPVSAFTGIENERERSLALFREAGKVIQHPRCVNCHPAGDRPLQGEDGHPHLPLVVRGPAGFGATGMNCNNCHGPTNFDAARVPGPFPWHLAPLEMAWEGKSLGEICEQIKDPDRNGGKTMEQLVHHMAEDGLVGWGWHPGEGRRPAPGTQKEFGALIAAWAESGGVCPSP